MTATGSAVAWFIASMLMLAPGVVDAQFKRVKLDPPAGAADPPVDPSVRLPAEEARQLASPLAQVAADPSLISSFRGAFPTVTVGVYRDKEAKTISAQAKVAEVFNSDLSLTFSSPFDGDAGDEQILLADLNGLVGATSGELALSSRTGRRLEYRSAVRIGHREFDFVDPNTFVADSRSRTGWSGQAAVGYIRSAASMHGGYRYEHSWSGGAETTVCVPAGPPGGSTCSVVNVGAPNDTERHIAEGDVRLLFSHQGRATLGVSPAVHYDIKNRVLGIELPLYFLPDEKGGGLSGGVRTGYVVDTRSDETRFTFAVFLGNVFSLR